ncbi:Gypsy retrotransposon integrase-like protein 1 [Microbotryomycetes sp. JL201]|nr:Gypsy retrotransposon integrase-like protein 1 [Microbotryomycetes sp. JL201]
MRVQQPTRRGPPKSYVASLERRLEAMESLLKNLSASSGQDSSALLAKLDALSAADAGTATPEEVGLGEPRMQPDNAALDSIDKLADELDELTVDHDRYVGRGSGLHLARTVGVVCDNEDMGFGKPDPHPLSMVEQAMSDEHRREAYVHQLPPPDLAQHLVDVFFANFNRYYSFLHRGYFDRQIAAGKLDSDMSFRSLYFSVLALGARFSDDERVNVPLEGNDVSANSATGRGFQYFKGSIACASPVLIAATLYDMQAAVLNVVWLLGAASPLSAWQAIGYASMISSALGRPLAINDDDYDLLAGADVTDDELDEWEANGKASPPASALQADRPHTAKAWLSITKIQGIVLRTLYGMKSEIQSPQKISEHVCYLDSLLNAWLETVPERLRWNQNEPDDVILTQAANIYSMYYSTQILVHREFLSPSRAKVAGFPSLAICSNAARSCANILDVMRQRGLLKVNFIMVPMQAITAALIMLINVFSGGGKRSDLTSSAMKDVKRCYDALAELAENTFIAQKCYVGLTNLLAVDDSAPPVLKTTNLKRGASTEWPDSASPASSVPSNSSSPPGTGENSANRPAKRRETGLPMSTTDLSQTTFNGRPTFAPTSTMGGVLEKHASLSSLPGSNPQFNSSAINVDFAGMEPAVLQQMMADLNASIANTEGNSQSAQQRLWSGTSGSPGVGYGSSLAGSDFAAFLNSHNGQQPPFVPTSASLPPVTATQSNVAPIDAALYNLGAVGPLPGLPTLNGAQIPLPSYPHRGQDTANNSTSPGMTSTSAGPSTNATNQIPFQFGGEVSMSTPLPTSPTPAFTFNSPFGSTGLTPGLNSNNNFWGTSVFGDFDFGPLADFGLSNNSQS